MLVTDNGHALCGPHIISEWLDESFGVFKRDRRLLAEDPFRRAEIRRLVEWFLIKFEQDVVRPLVRERVIKLHLPSSNGSGSPDPKMLRTGRANIRQHMKYLSWLAGSRTWLAGDRLSYAGPCRRQRPVGAGLSRRDRLDRLSAGQGLVSAGQVPPFLQTASVPTGSVT